MSNAHASPFVDGGARLLFPSGKRPDGDAIREAVNAAGRIAITHEMRAGGPDGGPLAVELLRDGLTYDLIGIAPGSPAPRFFPRHRFGVNDAIAPPELDVIVLQPGPHLIAGAQTLPVVRTLLSIVRALSAALPDLQVIGWPPAGSAIGAKFFAATVDTWLEGGAFPALGLTAFATEPDGGLRSDGMAFFTGQEIVLPGGLAESRMETTRLAVRLVHHLVHHGRLSDRDVLTAPDGRPIILQPVEGGRTVRIEPG